MTCLLGIVLEREFPQNVEYQRLLPLSKTESSPKRSSESVNCSYVSVFINSYSSPLLYRYCARKILLLLVVIFSFPWKVRGTLAPVLRFLIVVLSTPVPRACLLCWQYVTTNGSPSRTIVCPTRSSPSEYIEEEKSSRILPKRRKDAKYFAVDFSILSHCWSIIFFFTIFLRRVLMVVSPKRGESENQWAGQ